MTVETLRDLIAQSLDADKAEDITIIDLQSQSPLADYMIVATGTSSRHVSALAGNLKKKLELRHVKGIRTEGMAQSDWVAIGGRGQPESSVADCPGTQQRCGLCIIKRSRNGRRVVRRHGHVLGIATIDVTAGGGELR